MGQRLDRTSIIEGESPQTNKIIWLVCMLELQSYILQMMEGSNQMGITEGEFTKQTRSEVLEQDNLARMYVGVICTLESYILHLKDDRRLKSNDV